MSRKERIPSSAAEEKRDKMKDVLNALILGGTLALGTPPVEAVGVTPLENAAVRYQVKGSKEEAKDLSFENDPVLAEKILAEEMATVEQTRSELLAHIESDAYLNKLTIEFSGDREEALRQQKLRALRVRDTLIEMLSQSEMKSRFGKADPAGTWVIGITRNAEKKIYLPLGLSTENLKEVTRHELEHRATDLNTGIPEKTKATLVESFRSYAMKDGTSAEAVNKYFKIPSERLVRKQQTDFEMERLGIKKYGEPFMREHYEKLREAQGKRILTRNTEELMETTNPDDFVKIFNTIAKADEDGADDAAA